MATRRTKTPKKGMGRVFRRERRDRTGRPRIETTFTIEYYFHGKQVRQATEYTDAKEAMAFLQTRLSEIHADTYRPPISGVTFEMIHKLVIEHRESNNLCEKTRPKLTEHFAKWHVADITDLEILAYRRKRLAEKAARATINRELQELYQSFQLARKARLVNVVPMFPARLREGNARKGFFEWTDFLAVVDHLPEHLRPLAHVAYRTGWRLRSELLTRRWTHVRLDAKNGWLRLDPGETKNGEGRMFPMTTELFTALTAQNTYAKKIALATGKEVSWLFVKPDGKRVNNIYKEWRAAAKASGITRIPHDFRRTAARNLEEAGLDRLAAMKMIGHKTEEMYRRYAIVDHRVMDRAKEKLIAFEQQQRAEPQSA